MKRCSRCGLEKPFDQFYRRAYTDARRSKCIECFLFVEKERRANSTYQRDYLRKHDLRIKERKRLKRNTIEGRAKDILSQAKRRAVHQNLPFDLTLDFILEKLTVGLCERSGLPFDLDKSKNHRVACCSPSLDKKNRSEGYTTANVQLVCYMYNAGKSEYTDEEFINFCKAVVRYNGAE